MAEKDNTFQNTVEALFRGMDSFITTKTVVGEAIHIDDTILLPLVDVSFGVGAGAFAENAKNNAGGGMGGKISPSAVLVISKNGTRLVNIKNQDAVTTIIDMDPASYIAEARHSSLESNCSTYSNRNYPGLRPFRIRQGYMVLRQHGDSRLPYIRHNRGVSCQEIRW